MQNIMFQKLVSLIISVAENNSAESLHKIEFN